MKKIEEYTLQQIAEACHGMEMRSTRDIISIWYVSKSHKVAGGILCYKKEDTGKDQATWYADMSGGYESFTPECRKSLEERLDSYFAPIVVKQARFNLIEIW